MLREVDNSLSNDLNADFKRPNWSSVFKFNLDTDSGIPLNKRDSGVRRLILLNFFRSEARRKQQVPSIFFSLIPIEAVLVLTSF